jgi:hypothetical protein
MVAQLCRAGALEYGLENAKTPAATSKPSTTVKAAIGGQILRRRGGDVGITVRFSITFQTGARRAPLI